MTERKESQNKNENIVYGAQLFAGWDELPLSCVLWNEELKPIDCNQAALKLFHFNDKKEFTEKFVNLSFEKLQQGLLATLIHKRLVFDWNFFSAAGHSIQTEVTAVQVNSQGCRYLMTYFRELKAVKSPPVSMGERGEKSQIMLDAIPICCTFWDEKFNNIDCNQEAVALFDLNDKQEYMDVFWQLSPLRQPDGRLSDEKLMEKLETALHKGRCRFEWMHQKLNGELIPSEITLVKVKRGEHDIVVGYTRDLRELKATVAMMSRLEHLAFVDELTGIYNRRYFMETAEKYFLNFSSFSRPISIIMMDIDHFKSINDTYGHVFGDIVLKHTAEVSRKVLRSTDLFARYGGEEFIIMILDAEKDFALKLAERVRRAVESAEIQFNEITLKSTISLGVATKTDRDTSLEEMIQYADEALYTAKQEGRNTVRSYG